MEFHAANDDGDPRGDIRAALYGGKELGRDLLLLSVRPAYAKKIFDGTKTVELRRRRPRVQAGDVALVYVSAPRKALVGSFEVGGVAEDKPCELWPEVAGLVGLSRELFDAYFRGAAVAYGILVRRPVVFGQELPLDQLKERMPGFHPPQGYHYLPCDEARQLVG